MAKLGSAPGQPSVGLLDAVEDALGSRSTSWRKPHTGLSPAQRFIVQLANGTSVFVKAAVDAETEGWLRTEHRMLSTLERMVPAIVAWLDHGDHPVLVVEDLSDAYWPADHWRRSGDGHQAVRWEPGQIEQLLEALDHLSTVLPPPELMHLGQGQRAWWPSLVSDLGRVESLGVCDAAWLRPIARDLLDAEAALDLTGDALVHNDVRSDNVCFRGSEVILVDWSDPRIGWDSFDQANLLQGMPLEGGPDPFNLMPHGGPFAAWRAGEMLHRAIHDDVPDWLRRVFHRMAAIDLDWAAASLGLAPRIGPRWHDL